MTSISFVSLDSFSGFPFYNNPIDLTIDLMGSYCRPESIIKSSVGDFYDDSMRLFFKTILLLKNNVPHKDLLSLCPIGVLVGNHINVNPDENLDSLACHPLKEVRDVACTFGGRPNKYINRRVEDIEKISHSLCAGYTPQEVGDVTRWISDSGFLSESMIANMLYPWVTQPVGQLRMLVPSLPNSTRSHIIKIHLDRERLGYIPNSLDTGYAYTYDIISDFLTYQQFGQSKIHSPINIMRQFRTPFLNFDLPVSLLQLGDKEKKMVDDCVQRSKKLYIEMLKTGLRYEAQYAILCGFRTRFCINCNLAAIIELVEVLSGKDNKVDRIINAIKEDVLKSQTWAEGSVDLFK
jgi:hypothetical protein